MEMAAMRAEYQPAVCRLFSATPTGTGQPPDHPGGQEDGRRREHRHRRMLADNVACGLCPLGIDLFTCHWLIIRQVLVGSLRFTLREPGIGITATM